MFVSAFKTGVEGKFPESPQECACEYCFTIKWLVTRMGKNAGILHSKFIWERENNKINQLLNTNRNKNSKLNKLPILPITISRRWLWEWYFKIFRNKIINLPLRTPSFVLCFSFVLSRPTWRRQLFFVFSKLSVEFLFHETRRRLNWRCTTPCFTPSPLSW